MRSALETNLHCLIAVLFSLLGPDYHGSHIKSIVVREENEYEIRFHASILHMRGAELTKQPFMSGNGDVLLWNGEIFDGLEVMQFFTRILRSL